MFNKIFSLKVPFFYPADQSRNTVPQKKTFQNRQKHLNKIKWNADNIFKHPGMILQFPEIIKGHTDTSPVYLLLHSKLPGADLVHLGNSILLIMQYYCQLLQNL